MFWREVFFEVFLERKKRNEFFFELFSFSFSLSLSPSPPPNSPINSTNESNSEYANGVGEWMVAQTVMGAWRLRAPRRRELLLLLSLPSPPRSSLSSSLSSSSPPSSPPTVSALTAAITSLACTASRPVVGSSRKSTRGSPTSATPMLTRL